jgi:hypothetical protein
MRLLSRCHRTRPTSRAAEHCSVLLLAAAAPLQVYTREYVSPEVAQAVVGGAVSIVAQPSWDLWGIGIIMWEMVTGGGGGQGINGRLSYAKCVHT